VGAALAVMDRRKMAAAAKSEVTSFFMGRM
jgi:hypothetical protein